MIQFYVRKFVDILTTPTSFAAVIMSLPIKRPTKDEDEEDLLRLQAEFMKQKSNSVKKDKIDIHEDFHEAEEAVPSRKRKISKQVPTVTIIIFPHSNVDQSYYNLIHIQNRFTLSLVKPSLKI